MSNDGPAEPTLLFDRVRKGDDRRALQQAVQLAIQVEFTTIPAYLSAMYSIKDPSAAAYQALRSVVMEEMFHLNQAANLLIAIGGLPQLTDGAVPTYPTYLPKANPDTTPFVSLQGASRDVFQNVFSEIEVPAPPMAPPQGDQYDTIAQLYDSVRVGLERFRPPEALFKPNPRGWQRTDIYLGKFGGKPVEVTDLASARFAIAQIIEQGEGHAPWAQPLVPTERWGTYNSYGLRTDGTYGPIIGQPYEATHFIKFRTFALPNSDIPETWPIIANPKRTDFTNPDAISQADDFDHAYSVMLKALEAAFRKQPAGASDPFFTTALPLMHDTLPSLALRLMQTPAFLHGDGAPGPNAAPLFVFDVDATVAGLRDRLHRAATTSAVGFVQMAATARGTAAVDQARITKLARHRHEQRRLLSRAAAAVERMVEP